MQVGEKARGFDGEPKIGGAPTKRSPELAPVSYTAAANSGEHMNLSYEQLNEANKIPRDAQAHHKPYSLLGEVGEGQG
jgi:hypothetical protein